MRRTLLEGKVVHSLVEVDGVLPGDDVVESGSGSSGLNITVSKAHALIAETAGRRASGVTLIRHQIRSKISCPDFRHPRQLPLAFLFVAPSVFQYANALLPALIISDFE